MKMFYKMVFKMVFKLVFKMKLDEMKQDEDDKEIRITTSILVMMMS